MHGTEMWLYRKNAWVYYRVPGHDLIAWRNLWQIVVYTGHSPQPVWRAAVLGQPSSLRPNWMYSTIVGLGYLKKVRIVHTVIRFLWVSAKFSTCTVVRVNGTLVEDKMLRFKGECEHFRFNKCPIYTHDGASAKFSTNSQEMDNSAWWSSALFPHRGR